MTTGSHKPDYTGPESVINPFPSYRVGITADMGLALSAQALRDEQKAIIPSSDYGKNEQWDIGKGDLIFGVNPDMLKNWQLPMSSRSFGKSLALANTAHLPHGLQPNDLVDIIKYYSPEEVNRIKRQALRRAIVFYGISEGSFLSVDGPNKSPGQDGIPVIIGGQSTIATYFEEMPCLFQDVTYDLLSDGGGADGVFKVSKTNSQKVPITLKPVKPRGTIDQMTLIMRDYARKLVMAGKSTRTRLPCDMNIVADSITAPMLQDDKNAALMAFGLVTMFAEFYAEFQTTIGGGGGGGIPMFSDQFEGWLDLGVGNGWQQPTTLKKSDGSGQYQIVYVNVLEDAATRAQYELAAGKISAASGGGVPTGNGGRVIPIGAMQRPTNLAQVNASATSATSATAPPPSQTATVTPPPPALSSSSTNATTALVDRIKMLFGLKVWEKATMGSDAEAGRLEQCKNLSMLIVKMIGEPSKSATSASSTTGGRSGTRAKQGFTAFCGAVKEIDCAHGKAVGRIVGVQPGDRSRTENGWRTVDFRVY